jgi:hypothetical protein
MSINFQAFVAKQGGDFSKETPRSIKSLLKVWRKTCGVSFSIMARCPSTVVARSTVREVKILAAA